MENIRQRQSDQFWQTHFEDLLDTPFDEGDAQQMDFWDILHDTLTRVDEETVKAVMVSKPIIGITSGAMYLRIVKTAKRVWDKRNRPI